MSAIKWPADLIGTGSLPPATTARKRSRPVKPLRDRPIAPVLPFVPAVPRAPIAPIAPPAANPAPASLAGADLAHPAPGLIRGTARPRARRSAPGQRVVITSLALSSALLLLLLLLPGNPDVATPERPSPLPLQSVAPSSEALSSELAALRVRHADLSAELADANRLTSVLQDERDALLVSNEQLNAEIDALMVETTDLNLELLDLEFALSAARQENVALASAERPVEDDVERRIVYNFVNVPIGSHVSSVMPDTADPSGRDVDNGARAVIEPMNAMDRQGPDMASPDQPDEDLLAAEPDIDSMIASFYQDVQNGVPTEDLTDSLGAIDETGLVPEETMRALYQELIYLWDEGAS